DPFFVFLHLLEGYSDPVGKVCLRHAPHQPLGAYAPSDVNVAAIRGLGLRVRLELGFHGDHVPLVASPRPGLSWPAATIAVRAYHDRWTGRLVNVGANVGHIVNIDCVVDAAETFGNVCEATHTWFAAPNVRPVHARQFGRNDQRRSATK